MIAIFDSHYRDDGVTTACVVIAAWTSATPLLVERRDDPAASEYVPGMFYKRELPGILGLLPRLPLAVEVLLIDGYVWLGEGHPGLGAHLHQQTGGRWPVVGVAKTHYKDVDPVACAVTRGESAKPLWVTAAGMELSTAADGIRAMHGGFRIPTMVRLADATCRE